MKACILTGGAAGMVDPLTRFLPLAMAPVLNRPLIGHIMTALAGRGVREALVTCPSFPEMIDVYLHGGAPWGIPVNISLERQLLGSAASVRRIPSYFDGPVLVVPTDALVDFDLDALSERHRASEAVLTLVLAPPDGEPATSTRFVLADDGRVVEPTTDPAAPVFTGIAIVTRKAGEIAPRNATADIGRDLVPAVLACNLPVAAILLDRPWKPLRDIGAYWDLNLGLLGRGDFQAEHLRQIAPNVWVEAGARVHKSAIEATSGPVLVGRECRIGRNVRITGPTIIGHHSIIDASATLIRSVVLDHTYIGRETELNEAIVTRNVHISVPRKFGTVVEENFIIGPVARRSFRQRMDHLLISATDRTLAFLGLLFLSPVLAIIAFLIRFSPGDRGGRGPILYKSKRLARPSETVADDRFYAHTSERAVTYYVFRTMYVDADRRMRDMENANIYETGPYRKIKDDPRVTGIGRFLRKTSLDELPLLWNVLSGDLSLVGVWALPTYEAEELATRGLVSGRIDLSETARVRFRGRLGLAGFWQARGRSDLSAEERATHDAYQAALSDVPEPLDSARDYLDTMSYRAYLRIIAETFWATLNRRGSIG